MESGDVIPMDRTSIPIQPSQLLVNLDRFVNSIDTEDVSTVLGELGDAFEGSGKDLQRLVDAGDLLTRAATDALPQTLKLIEDGNTVLDTQRDVSGQFRSYNRDLRALTATLRSSDPDFRNLFADGTQSALATTDLIESNRTDLPILMDNLITTAQVQKVRIPAIRQILVTYPNVVAGGFTVAPGDGTAHFGTATTEQPGVCERGYENGLRNPKDTSVRTPNLGVFCAEPEPIGVRGAQHSPRPGNLQPVGGGQSGGSAAATQGSSQQSSVLLGDYDPKTGRSITSDGQTFTLGTTAGAAQVFGSSSWQWLLVGPLSRK